MGNNLTQNLVVLARLNPELKERLASSTKAILNASLESMRFRRAYLYLRNLRTTLVTKGATESVMHYADGNGKLSSALQMQIPKVNRKNRWLVTRQVVDRIDDSMLQIIVDLKSDCSRLKDSIHEHIEALKEYSVSQKRILELMKSAVIIPKKQTNINICTNLCRNCIRKAPSLAGVRNSLSGFSGDWSLEGLVNDVNALGYRVVMETMEDLDPEQQIEEAIPPDQTIVPVPNGVDGSDTPNPPEQTGEPGTAVPSQETPDKLFHDALDSLAEEVGVVNDLDKYEQSVSDMVAEAEQLPERLGEHRTAEKVLLSARAKLALSGSILTAYGRELNRHVNDLLAVVVRGLCKS